MIDAHVHIFPPEVAADRERYRARDPYFADLYADPKAGLATAEDLIAELDRVGFSGAVAVAWGWRDSALRREQNAYMVDVARRYPDRIICLAAAHPDDSPEDLARVGDALAAGLRGIGELMPHGQGYRLDDGVGDALTLALSQRRGLGEGTSSQRVRAPGRRARIAALVEVAEACRVPILTHVSEPVGHVYPGKGDDSPAGFLALAMAYPGTRFIAAHWGGGLPFYALMPEVRRALANTWFDSAASPYLYDRRVFRIGVDLVGADRVLFGSDYALLPIDRAARQVERSSLDAAERAAVLGNNARTVYGQVGVAAP